jgi:hypothetical protein
LELLCRQSPCRLAPASEIKCPRQELNLAFDLRRVACESATLRGPIYITVIHSAPRRGIEPRLAVFEDCRARPAHSQGVSLNQSIARPGIEPATEHGTWACAERRAVATQTISPSKDRTWSCSFGGCRADPAHSRTIHAEPTTGFAPAPSGLQDRCLSQSSHVGEKNQARARAVEPPVAVLEAASSPRRTLV